MVICFCNPLIANQPNDEDFASGQSADMTISDQQALNAGQSFLSLQLRELQHITARGIQAINQGDTAEMQRARNDAFRLTLRINNWQRNSSQFQDLNQGNIDLYHQLRHGHGQQRGSLVSRINQ